MRIGKSRIFFITSILLVSLGVSGVRLTPTEGMSSAPNSSAAPYLGEPSLPIEIKWITVDKPVVGHPARFQLEVESRLDPDLIPREVRIEYDLPPRLLRPAALQEESVEIKKSGRNRLELGLIIPDEARYEIRARVILTLRNGKRLSQTAVQWVDLGSKDPPPGMIDRIENRDGSGIRVYRGVSVGGGNE